MRYFIAAVLLCALTIASQVRAHDEERLDDITCPRPTRRELRCLRQWSCEHASRVDLNCVLNPNRNPTIANLLNVPGSDSVGSGRGILGTVTGIIGGILGPRTTPTPAATAAPAPGAAPAPAPAATPAPGGLGGIIGGIIGG